MPGHASCAGPIFFSESDKNENKEELEFSKSDRRLPWLPWYGRPHETLSVTSSGLDALIRSQTWQEMRSPRIRKTPLAQPYGHTLTMPCKVAIGIRPGRDPSTHAD